MFDPGGPVPGALAVRAWSTRGGVAVSWPEGAPRPAALSAAVGPDTDAAPGPMIVHAFALTPELVEDDPGQPPGPGRPWAEFRRALIDEAVRRRPA